MLVLPLLSLLGCTPHDADVNGEYFVWLAANSVAAIPAGDQIVARLPRPANSVATNPSQMITGRAGARVRVPMMSDGGCVHRRFFFRHSTRSDARRAAPATSSES